MFSERSRPFLVLRRVFLARLVDFELLSAEADTSKLVGGFATLLAGVSFAITAPLILINGLPQEMLWGMEHFLISLSMALAGLFALISWESIFPDRRDILILGTLPVKLPTLFFAKFSAVVTALGVAVVSLNCFTGLGWAMLFEPVHGGILGLFRSVAAYWITVSLAGGFVFCCILTLHGLISLLLPRQLYLQLSGVLQMAGLAVVAGDFMLEPSLASSAALTAAQNQHLLHSLPSYWFLGLFQSLNGSMRGPTHAIFADMSDRAWAGLLMATGGALLSVFMAYFRVLPRIVEDPELQPLMRSLAHRLPGIGDPVQRAILAFSWKTLLRNRQHRLLLGLFVGTGLTIILLSLHTPLTQQQTVDHTFTLDSSFSIATLAAMLLAVLGARIIAEIPVMLKANWIFQVTQIHPSRNYRTAARRALFTIGVLPLLSLNTGLALWLWSGWLAVVHLAALGLLGTVLVDISVFTLRKLPFLCSWLPGRANSGVVFFGGVIVGIPLVISAGQYENELLRKPWGWAWLLGGLFLSAILTRKHLATRNQAHEALVFEEEETPALVSLQLNH